MSILTIRRRADVKDKRLRHELAVFLNYWRKILRRFRRSGEIGPANLVNDTMEGARMLAEQMDGARTVSSDAEWPEKL